MAKVAEVTGDARAPLAADEAGGVESMSAAPPRVPWATNPYWVTPDGAAGDVTDPSFGRLLLKRLGVGPDRFVGNMVVLRADADGKPVLMVGPYWTMLLFVTVPLAVVAPTLVAVFWCGRLHAGVTAIYAAAIAFGAAALASTALRNPGLLRRRDAAPDEGPTWHWNDQAKTYKPPGARYCTWCDAVFLDFDHTCPWTGTAIARGNLTSFHCFVGAVQVLFYSTIAIFILGALGIFPRK